MLRWIHTTLLVLLFMSLVAYIVVPRLPETTSEQPWGEIMQLCEQRAHIRPQDKPTMQHARDYAQCLYDFGYKDY
jgi:hypothetical protein